MSTVVYEYPEGRCWLRNGVPVPGTDIDLPYTVTEEDAGCSIRRPLVVACNAVMLDGKPRSPAETAEYLAKKAQGYVDPQWQALIDAKGTR